MGFQILFFLQFLPASLVLYLFIRAELRRPKGDLLPAYDETGHPLMDNTGQQMFIDEKGRTFTNLTGRRHIQRERERQRTHDCIVFACIAQLFR